MATEDRTIILITGANSGIGFELAAQLLADPSKQVLLCSRSVEKGETAVTDLQKRKLPGTVELVHLDVDDPECITAAAKDVGEKHGRVDALVNNAALGGWHFASAPQQFEHLFRTNSTGPFLMGEAFLPLLKNSKNPRIVNISSGAGSFGRRMDPNAGPHKLGMSSIAYCTTKAALNYITLAQWTTYGKEGVKVFAMSPGFVASNLGPQNTVEGGAKPTAEGVVPILKILNGERDDEQGKLLIDGGVYPW